jgi:hypothetical protein
MARDVVAARGRDHAVKRSSLRTWSHLVVSLLIVGCRSYAQNTPRTVLEGDDAANYRRVFGEPPFADVDILNSVVVSYSWRPGVVTTDDWEFEVLAPRAWIDRQVESLSLSRAEGSPSEDEMLADVEARRPLRVGYHWWAVLARKRRPIRAWYAPKPLAAYEVYYLGATSIPYVHMLIERDATSDGRHRVFLSKH